MQIYTLCSRGSIKANATVVKVDSREAIQQFTVASYDLANNANVTLDGVTYTATLTEVENVQRKLEHVQLFINSCWGRWRSCFLVINIVLFRNLFPFL